MNRNILEFISIALIIGLFISISWLIRLDALVKLEVITDYAMLDLAETWQMPLRYPLRLDSLYVDHVDINATNAANILSVEIEPQIDEANVYLQALKIVNTGQISKVEMAADAHSLNIFLKQSHLVGTFNTPRLGNRGIKADDEKIPPETIHFQTKSSLSSENRIELCTEDSWLLCKMRLHKITIMKETLKGSGNFIPTVKSGQLQILNSGKVLQLGWADTLSLEKIKETRRIIIKKDPEGFKISFMGKTGFIKAGPQGYEHDWRPRFLEAFYNNQFYQLSIAACVMLWALYKLFHSFIRKKGTP